MILEEDCGYRRFSYLRESIPFPAFNPDLEKSRRVRLTEYYVRRLASLSVEHDVGYARIAVPALCQSQLGRRR